MTMWNFNNTLFVREGPVAWDPLFERFKLNRALTIQETAHDVFVAIRYDSYTNELNYTGTGPGAPTVIQPNGLRHYRGGYTYVVSDQDKADLIASGLVDSTFFVAIPGT